jgi:2',3'-cyclic-nucleotide 2'-phosphodiesterase (5'-nucleotidase family)
MGVRSRLERTLSSFDGMKLADLDAMTLGELNYMPGYDITLVKGASSESRMGVSSYLSGDIALKRLRRLSDIDGMSLADIDNMTLGELKYTE